MATQAQIDANRKNSQKSTGPKSQPGKDKTRFNGLRHGLRAEQVVLPGEDAAEFEAERKGWFDDWKPTSHTRAVLVERAAIASWRLRRSVRSEAARLRKLAVDASARFDLERRKKLERGIDLFDSDAPAALSLLQSDATGVDQLLEWWGEMDAMLMERGPDAWDAQQHARLMVLLGHEPDRDPAEAGPLLLASSRLAAANDPDDDAPALAEAEAEDIVSEILGFCDALREELQGIRARLVDPEVLRKRAVDAASIDTSKEAALHHRYEMAHDRSLRATVNQLMALEKSGADLADWSEDVIEPAVAPAEPAAPTEANPVSESEADAPTEANFPGLPSTPSKADRDREGRTWAVEAAEGAVSPPSHS